MAIPLLIVGGRVIDPGNDLYSPSYSPLVDLYANPNIAAKTILTIGDGLFGAPSATSSPTPWSTFGDDAPSSLLLSRDPVAIDCVMCDLLHSEWSLPGDAYDYLRLAAQSGLGTFDQGDPWGGGYQYLEYLRLDL